MLRSSKNSFVLYVVFYSTVAGLHFDCLSIWIYFIQQITDIYVYDMCFPVSFVHSIFMLLPGLSLNVILKCVDFAII